jgi:hypothetical protein
MIDHTNRRCSKQRRFFILIYHKEYEYLQSNHEDICSNINAYVRLATVN